MLGVGIGDYPSDFRVMQIPYDQKNRITDEYIDVLNAAFKGGHVDFSGPDISFENASYFPPTVRRRCPCCTGAGWCTRVPAGSPSSTSLRYGESRSAATAGYLKVRPT